MRLASGSLRSLSSIRRSDRRSSRTASGWKKAPVCSALAKKRMRLTGSRLNTSASATLSRPLSMRKSLVARMRRRVRQLNVGGSTDSLGRSRRCLAIKTFRLVVIQTQIGDLGCDAERARALQKCGIRQFGGVLLSDNKRAPATPTPSSASSRPIGSSLSLRSPSMKPTRPSASRRWSRAASRAWIAVTASAAGHSHPGERCRRQPRQPPLAPRLLALDEVVEADAEHSGDDLEEAHPPAVAGLAQVGGERLGALAGRPSAPVIFVAQRAAGSIPPPRGPGCRWRTARRRRSPRSTQPSGRMRLKASISALVQRDLAAAGEHSTIRKREAASASLDFRRRGRPQRQVRAGRGRWASAGGDDAVGRSACPTSGCGTRNFSSSLMQPVGSFLRPRGCSSGRRNSGVRAAASGFASAVC